MDGNILFNHELSDLSLDNNYNILPGIPQIKLWQDVCEEFNLKYENLQKVRNKLNKYYITYEKDNKENFPIK